MLEAFTREEDEMMKKSRGHDLVTYPEEFNGMSAFLWGGRGEGR